MKNTNKEINIAEHSIVLIIVCLIGLIANHFYQFSSSNSEMTMFNRFVSSPISISAGIKDSFVGMIIIYVITMLGLMVAKLVPFYLPSIAWISLIAILATSPISPVDNYVLESTASIGVLPLATPILAYAGFAIADREIAVFKKSGLKLFAVGMFVFIGTYIGSALVANMLL